jgi:membrane protease YdiL (CAAX protease family)
MSARSLSSTSAPVPSTDPTTVRSWMHHHRLLTFTVIAYTISWSLLIGGFLGAQTGTLNPDGPLVGVMIQVAAAGPLIAAVIVLARTSGRAGLAGLGRSIVRWRVNPLWYAFIFVGVPCLMVAAVAVFYPGLIPGLTDNWSLLYTKLPLEIVLIAVVTGLAEEPGWRGYAQPTANQRYRPLLAALVVSLIWAAWHLPNALFGPTLTDTATHFLATVVNGFVLAWAYNSTRSVLVVMLLHGAQNASNGLIRALFDGATATPTPSSYYLISALTFGALMIVVAVLTRGRLGLGPAADTNQSDAAVTTPVGDHADIPPQR